MHAIWQNFRNQTDQISYFATCLQIHLIINPFHIRFCQLLILSLLFIYHFLHCKTLQKNWDSWTIALITFIVIDINRRRITWIHLISEMKMNHSHNSIAFFAFLKRGINDAAYRIVAYKVFFSFSRAEEFAHLHFARILNLNKLI